MTKKYLVPIVLPADPAAPMEAATKQYVDSQGSGLPDGDLPGQLLATYDGTGDNVMWVNPPDEVYVGTGQPTDPWFELWYDTDAPIPDGTYLVEPFNNLTTNGWQQGGGSTIVAGRHGTSVEVPGGNTLTYTIPTVSQTAAAAFGVAHKVDSLAAARSILAFMSDSGGTTHLSVNVNANGSLYVNRGSFASGTLLATSAAGVIVPGTYAFIEGWATLHDTSGSFLVKVNGIQVLFTINVDTKNAGTKTVFDRFRLYGGGSGAINTFDDLWLRADATMIGDVVGLPGALKVNVGGTWVPITSGGTTDEVWIGTAEPTDTALELWYDPDDDTATIASSAQWNSAWGQIGYAEVVANQAGITVETALVGLSVAVNVVQGRRLRVTAHAALQNTTADFSTLLAIKQDDLTVQAKRISHALTSSAGIDSFVVLTPTAGTHTYAVTASPNGGSVTLAASPTAPTFLLVEDIGPAAGPVPIANPNPQYAKGFIDRVVGTATSGQATTANWVVLAGTAKSITFLSTRRYRVTGRVIASMSAAGEWWNGGVAINGTIVAQSTQGQAAVGVEQCVTFEDTFTIQAGTWVVDMRYGKYYGSGTVSGRHDIMPPMWALYDVGPA